MIKWIVLLLGILPATAMATWKPEYDTASEAIMTWFRRAQPTKEAAARLGFSSCCEHSDRFVTKFKVSKVGGTDEWFYQDGNRWILIPQDVIHTEGIIPPKGHENDPDFLQLKAEGVLFVYNGTPTCFWAPEGGG